ncbi:MAG: DNA polymerase/3'-5' exonuclease PolX [FCB group bacterium]|jgi:DNA polymerase (family 10)|nr:DNA polymerase/3'-5' exonuclease PolX [FCB group bacterium]
MTNRDIISALEEIGFLLELAGENPFKTRSYENAARTLGMIEEDIETLVREERLREVPGIGQAIEQKITELVTKGRLKYLDELREKFPPSLFQLFSIPGLGAKRVRILFDELGIRSLGELEYAIQENRLLTLKGFGPKMQAKVLEGIGFARQQHGQHLCHVAWREAARLRERLEEDPSLLRIAVAGSLRRCKEIVKDIDILASSKDPESLMERFVTTFGVVSVTNRGDTKSSVILGSGIAADLRVVSDEQFPFALHYFTGSKEHNVVMRQRAKERGLKLNEYGLFKGEKLMVCEDEAELFERLDLPYIPPELREDMGEFSAKKMPKLVELDDLVGVFHCHTTYSDGGALLKQMAQGAKDRGYKYIVIADHSQSAGYAGGLSPATIKQQHEEIDKLNKSMKGFWILKSIESDIRSDGSLDYEESVLKTFDLVIASVHSRLTMNEEEATARLLTAIENPYTTILGHPTGRLLLARPGYPLNMGRIIDACAANRVAIEINANPHRLDLDWRHVKRAKDKGVKIAIGVDAHSVDGMDDAAYGIGIARKGWIERDDVLNCMSAEEVIEWQQSKRA